jgi:hypothetical protein
MKKISASVGDETYRLARMAAAARGTSVSALVRGFLNELAASEFERLKGLEADARQRIAAFSAADNLPRDELYRRR